MTDRPGRGRSTEAAPAATLGLTDGARSRTLRQRDTRTRRYDSRVPILRQTKTAQIVSRTLSQLYPYGRLTSAAYLRSIDRAFAITPRSEIVPVSSHW